MTDDQHRPDPDFCSPDCLPSDHLPPRTLVTLHYPLAMSCVAKILTAVSADYPRAVVAEDGSVLEYRRDAEPEDPPEPDWRMPPEAPRVYRLSGDPR